MKNLLLLCICFFSFLGLALAVDALYPEAKDSISCELTHLVSNTYNRKGKIINDSKKENSKVASIFTNLTSKTPKIISPNKGDLIKIHETDGVYWLLAKPVPGSIASVMYTIDTKRKVLVQARSLHVTGITHSSSWMGKCH